MTEASLYVGLLVLPPDPPTLGALLAELHRGRRDTVRVLADGFVE